MRSLINVLVIIFLLASCGLNKSAEDPTTNLFKDTVYSSSFFESEDIEKKDNILVAYSDSIPVYSFPHDTSGIIGYLDKLKSVERYNVYALYQGKLYISNSIINAEWFTIHFQNDTGWINKQDDISLKFDIDTFENIQLLHKTSIKEIPGSGYTGTQVRFFNSNVNILEAHLDFDYSFKLNDSLLLFSFVSDSNLISFPHE